MTSETFSISRYYTVVMDVGSQKGVLLGSLQVCVQFKVLSYGDADLQ